MRLLNYTSWKRGDLSRFLKAGLKAKGADHSQYVIAVTPSAKRRDYEDAKRRGAERWVGKDGKALHGYAYLQRMWSVWILGKKHYVRNKYFIRLFLPNGEFDLVKCAQLLEHEIDHSFGLNHKDMMKSDDLKVEWCKGLTLTTT